MQLKQLELTVGGFVAAGLVALFMLAMKVSNFADYSGNNTYSLSARFENIGGLKPKAPVTAAGVAVGRVASIVYDKETFEAIVTLNIDNQFDGFPEDTSASIRTSGLLGEQYIGLEPGGSMDMLEEGDEFMLTQSAMVWEKLISQFLYKDSVSESDGEE